jgi:hypothetical protein
MHDISISVHCVQTFEAHDKCGELAGGGYEVQLRFVHLIPEGLIRSIRNASIAAGWLSRIILNVWRSF